MTARDPGGRDDAQKVTEALRADLIEWGQRPLTPRRARQATEDDLAEFLVAHGWMNTAALDLPARYARVRAEALEPFEALADEVSAYADEPERAPGFTDGFPVLSVSRVLSAVEAGLRAALASAGPVEPSPAAEEADDPGPRWDYYRGVQCAAGEPLTGGEG